MKAIASKIIIVNGEPIISNSNVYIKSYRDYYPLLECNNFDVVMVDWLGYDISIFVDDEGLLKSGNYGREVEGYPDLLFGNMVICGGVDSAGETYSIPEEITLSNINEFLSYIKYEVK